MKKVWNLFTFSNVKKLLLYVFPILVWLPGYDKWSLKNDILAGITVAMTVIPQGMAYAGIAELPAVYGLYCGMIPPFFYTFFGTSRVLIVGPVAVLSLLLLDSLKGEASLSDSEYFAHIFMVSFISGLFQILLGICHVGFLTNLISHPVIAGFTSGAALVIGTSQLSSLFGITLPKSKIMFQIWYELIIHIKETNLWCLGLGISGIFIILVLKRFRYTSLIPGPLVAVLLGSILCWSLNLNAKGVSIIGTIPKGFPPIQNLDFENIDFLQSVLPTSFFVTIIGFMESFSIAKTFAIQTKSEINANVELTALGLSNMIGSFFSCYPSTGSFSRTAVNAKAGAKTLISNLVIFFIFSTKKKTNCIYIYLL